MIAERKIKNENKKRGNTIYFRYNVFNDRATILGNYGARGLLSKYSLAHPIFDFNHPQKHKRLAEIHYINRAFYCYKQFD